VTAGALAVVEVLNFPALVAGTTYEVKVVVMKNPSLPTAFSADLGVRLYEEDIATGARTYKHYDTYRVTLDLAASGAPPTITDAQVVAFEPGQKVGKNEKSYVKHAVWSSGDTLSAGDIYIAQVPLYLALTYGVLERQYHSSL